MSGLIIGGKEVVPMTTDLLPVVVHTWRETGIEFKAGDGFNKKRTESITTAVWHWTGGEQEPPDMARTLKQRKFGIEFAISRIGEIWQFCDPLLVDTADANFYNSFSVGTEIVCYGVADKKLGPPKLGKDRPTYEADINQTHCTVGDFYPKQYSAVIALAEVLSTYLPIPRVVSEHHNVLPPQKRFRGHVGHSNVTMMKIDPGPRVLDKLRDHFKQKVA